MLRAMLVAVLLCACEGGGDGVHLFVETPDHGGAAVTDATETGDGDTAGDAAAAGDAGRDAGRDTPPDTQRDAAPQPADIAGPDTADAATDSPVPAPDVPPDTFVCHDGEMGCAGDVVALCVDGAWSPVGGAPCYFGCYRGSCRACEPGSQRCHVPLNWTLEVCNPDGSDWVTVACPLGCSYERGACNVCPEGARRCVPNTYPESPAAWCMDECTGGQWTPTAPSLICCGTCECGEDAEGIGVACTGAVYHVPNYPCRECHESPESVECVY